jgi:peptidoglycan LD-endopeptidase CwlK
MRWAWLSSVAVLSIGGFIGARSLQPAHSLPPAADKPPEAAAPITAPQEQEAPAALEPEIVRVAVDSAMTREEALADQSFPAHVVAQMELIDVQYYGFAGELRQGQIVVHRDLAEEVREIFEEIRESRFPIEMVVPIVRFGWCDDTSMAANNTSGFNYRPVGGTRRLSQHAYGRAIDLNPLQNPFLHPQRPSPGVYDPAHPGTLTWESPVVQAFVKRGWTWGGSWKVKDYHHFEKPESRSSTRRSR